MTTDTLTYPVSLKDTCREILDKAERQVAELTEWRSGLDCANGRDRVLCVGFGSEFSVSDFSSTVELDSLGNATHRHDTAIPGLVSAEEASAIMKGGMFGLDGKQVPAVFKLLTVDEWYDETLETLNDMADDAREYLELEPLTCAEA